MWPVAEEGEAPNAGAVGQVHFPMAAKMSLYVMDGGEWAKGRETLEGLARELGVLEGEEPDCLVLNGDVQQVFDCVEAANRWCAQVFGWYALAATFSVNSPTA